MSNNKKDNFENLDLWNSVSKTDPQFTRHVQQRGGYTAISPQYQALMATKQFGSYGDGWGLSESRFNFDTLELTGMVLHEAIFFYVLNDKRIEFPIHNAIKPFSQTQNGIYSDEDWAKKVETNTISKALSRLGFSADVFMGLFDDHGYVSAIDAEFKIEKADDADEERERQRIEFEEWYKKHFETLSNAKSMNELEHVFKYMVRKLKHRQRETLIQEVTRKKDDVKKMIETKAAGKKAREKKNATA